MAQIIYPLNVCNSKLIWTKKSGHFIYEDEPNLVLTEIRTILNMIK